MLSTELILHRLCLGSRGSVLEHYTTEEIAAFADANAPHWDDETTEDVITESFVDDMWNTTKPCRRCSVCGRIMREGYFELDGLDYFGQPGGGYYCSDQCLHHVYSQTEYVQASNQGKISHKEWH